MDKDTLKFSIDSLTPETLSMARLAEYLKELSVLYGSQQYVHFDRVSPGSACLKTWIDEPAKQEVAVRLSSVKTGEATTDAIKAYGALDRLLRADNAVGSIYVDKGNNILLFPGRTKPEPESISIAQHTTVDGTVIKIGGRDDTIPVLLRDQEGKNIRCVVRGYTQAKELAKHYLESPIRVHGIGKWTRNEDGWNLEQLTIQSWTILDAGSAVSALKDLAQIEDNPWSSYEDPMREWRKMRGLD